MIRAWRDLPQERRLAALASVGLFFTLFLPWYQETVFANGVTSLRSASSSLTGWGAFSFVEAAVLLVAAAMLILLFVRAEGQAFHVPGGDGGVITAAGFWTCVLIVWRIFDKEGTSRHGQIAYTSGIEWGIFVALGVAAVLTYAGSQIRLAHEPEPPLPGEPAPQRDGGRTRRRGWLRKRSDTERRPATVRRPYPGPDMGADDDWTQEVRARRAAPPPASEAPTHRDAPEAPTRHDASEAPTATTPPRPPPSARGRAASGRARIRTGRSQRSGPGRLTAARSRISTSPSRRPRGWAARPRPLPTAPTSPADLSPTPPSTTRQRPRPGSTLRPTGPRIPATIS